jgi:hypothetical protein
MPVWEDVVATGLIGTDRRPVPDGLPPSWGVEIDQAVDPAHAVLSLAARHRALTRAGGVLTSCPPPTVAPPNRQPLASRAAHEILARLLAPPQVDLLNLWLAAAASRDERASASYWTPLAVMAARTADLDRTALAKAIGDRGIWFVEQNPLWARLAKGLRSQLPDAPSPEQQVAGVEVTEDAVRADPDLIMSAATPWSGQLSHTVLQMIGTGQLQRRGVRYAGKVGARLPLQHYELLRSAVEQITAQPELQTTAGSRSVREALLALERTVWLRLEMNSAFSDKPIMIQRVEIPPW